MGVTLTPVSDDDAGTRLDRWLKRQSPSLTQGRIEKLLRTGQIKVDQKKATSNQRLEAGQMVRVPPLGDDPPPSTPRPPKAYQPTHEDRVALTAAILHQDDQVIVLNKEAGLAVQGGTGTQRHLDALLDLLAGDGDRPRLVHRLDKDTSGVLVLARTLKAARTLTRAFHDRETQKIYWALVVGVPSLEQGTVTAPLAREETGRGERMAVDDAGGRFAVTDFRLIDQAWKTASWLEMRPRTGRTHQLRIHALTLGTPILGDGKYGGQDAFLPGLGLPKRLHLHARALSIPHPNGGVLSIVAEPPPHFRESLSELGFAVADAPDPFAGWPETAKK